jgi:hypothetical protein
VKTFSSSSLVPLRLGFEFRTRVAGRATTSALAGAAFKIPHQRINQFKLPVGTFKLLMPEWNFMNASLSLSQERGNLYSDGLRVTGNSQTQAAGESTEPSCGRPGPGPGLPSPSPLPGTAARRHRASLRPRQPEHGATEPQPGCSARDPVVSRQ